MHTDNSILETAKNDDGTVSLDAGDIIFKMGYEQGRIDALEDAIQARISIGDRDTAVILYSIWALEVSLRKCKSDC